MRDAADIRRFGPDGEEIVEPTARLTGVTGGAAFANGFFYGREGVTFISGE